MISFIRTVVVVGLVVLVGCGHSKDWDRIRIVDPNNAPKPDEVIVSNYSNANLIYPPDTPDHVKAAQSAHSIWQAHLVNREETIASLQKITEEHEGAWLAHYYMAEIGCQNQDWDLTRTHAEQAIVLDATDGWYRISALAFLAQAHEGQESKEKAVDVYYEAIALFPQNPTLKPDLMYLDTARMQMELGQWERAREDLGHVHYPNLQEERAKLVTAFNASKPDDVQPIQ